MATIQTTIQLQDQFTSVFSHVIEAVNLGFAAIEDLQKSISSPINTTAIEAARDSINQVAASVRKWEESLQQANQLTVSVPTVAKQNELPAPSLPETVAWSSYDGIEVFTNTGIERFEQELASVNTMLGQMSTLQEQITQKASGIEWLSPQAIQDIQNVENQVQRLKNQIGQVEANSLMIDTKESNAALEQMRFQMQQLNGEQEQLQAAMQGMDVSAINQAYWNLSQTLDGMERSVRDRFSSSVDWKSYNGIEVFTSTGVERFEQELTSVNVMLGQMGTLQSQISQRVSGMQFLSPQAIQDIQGVENRVQSLQGQMEQMKDYVLTMDTEEGNAALEQMRLRMQQLNGEQEQLQAAMQGMDVSAIQQAYQSLSQTLDGMERSARDQLSQFMALSVPPMEIPVVWKAEELEVFSGTGMERFSQEVQSANQMLERLSSTQDMIAKQVYNTSLFPPESFQSLNGLAVQIDRIRNRIQQIENHPVNFGTDQANAGLEQLRGQFERAVQVQQELSQAMQRMDVSAVNTAYLRLSQIISGTEQYIRDNVDEQGRFNQEIQEGTSQADGLIQTIKGVVGEYATIQTLSKVLNLSDQLTSTTARLNLMNDGLQSTQELQNMIYLSAERSRGSYQATADAVSKLGFMAGEAFGSSEEIIAFMEQVNKQFKIAGIEAAGVDAAMLQLIQAMGSGVLGGEEYNSILEQAPNIIQSIADYMEVPEEKLKDMAAEGQITADIVKAAMFAAAAETNAKFESMPKTFSEIWSSLQNTAWMAFQPVLQRINDVVNGEAFQEFVNGAIEALSVVAGIALKICDSFLSIANVVVENWSWLSPIIYGVVAALMVYYGWQMLCAGAAAVRAAKEAVLDAILRANSTMKIVLVMIALVAVIFAVCNAIAKMTGIANSGFSVITGSINVAIQFFKNLLFAVLNIVLGIGNAIGALTSNMITAFSNAICFVQSWFYDLLSTVLTVVGRIFEALNRLPFGEFDYSGITSAAEKYAAKAAEVLEDKKEYKSIENAFQKGFHTFDTFQEGWVSDAFQAGASWGDEFADRLSDLFHGGIEMPNEEDYTNISNYDAIGSELGGISENTGKIADNMEIAEEDLKYLRDIAEQEAINRFTTAEIKVEMGGITNQVNGNTDLDGMVDYLAEKLEETMYMTAAGVH